MWHFWRGLICKLQADQVKVAVVTPDGPYVPLLLKLGVQHCPVRISRFVSPLEDLRFCLDLYKVFRQGKFDLVCNITVKPNVYGAIVARVAGVSHVVAMVEGLGYAFEESVGLTEKVIGSLVRGLYWVGCHLSDRVGFANSDDRSVFVSAGLIAERKAIAFKSMIGVNLQEYHPPSGGTAAAEAMRVRLGIDEEAVLVVMVVARIVWSKGVREFAEASQVASGWARKACFLLVGQLDPHAKDAVDEPYLRNKASSMFKWIGFTNDIRSVWAIADIAVLPSYYREGVPRSLLEAMAMGKPIIATNNVGCREVVEDGKNGLLVPPRDTKSLAAAIERLVGDLECRKRFGEYSRSKAAAEFDEKLVFQRVTTELFQLR